MNRRWCRRTHRRRTRWFITALLALAIAGLIAPGAAGAGGTVTTLAGLAGHEGSVDGKGGKARLGVIAGLALDERGNLYATDVAKHVIRKITPTGVVSTLAGSPGRRGSQDGRKAAARFNGPSGIAYFGGVLYVADAGNCTIRAVTLAGVVTTLAGTPGMPGFVDGTGPAARFSRDMDGVACNAAGDVFVADNDNSAIRRITPRAVVTTVATEQDVDMDYSVMSSPTGIAFDRAGDLLIADFMMDAIDRLTPDGKLSVWMEEILLGPALGRAETGPRREASGATNTASRTVAARNMHPGPRNLALDAANRLLITGVVDDTDKYVDDAVHVGGTVAGDMWRGGARDGVAGKARFRSPGATACTPTGIVYVADVGNHTIRRITGMTAADARSLPARAADARPQSFVPTYVVFPASVNGSDAARVLVHVNGKGPGGGGAPYSLKPRGRLGARFATLTFSTRGLVEFRYRLADGAGTSLAEDATVYLRIAR